jgi:hypothetical protein
LANTTVSHSQTAISQANTLGCAIASPVTSTEPTHTTNITGLRSCVRGSSFRNASGSAFQSWRGENAPGVTVRPVRCACSSRRSTMERSVVLGGR